jgi:hypothetical protein
LNDEELQVFLGCTTHSFGQLSDEWKAWAKAVILSAKVDAHGKGAIQRNDAVLYLCQIIRVVEGFQKRITEDSLRGTFVSGLVACGFPPDTDVSFSFLRAMGDVQTRGFVAYEDVGWGRDEERLFRLTLAGQKLADSAAIPEPSETAQPMPSETAERRTDRPDYISLWRDASEVLNLAQELRNVVSELDQWENDEGFWGTATGIPNFREVTTAEITAAVQVIEALHKEQRFADTGDCLFPGTGDDTVDNVNVAIHAVFSFAEGITTRIGLDRFDTDGYPIRNDCNRCYILVKNLKDQLGKLEALPEVTSHMARVARDELRQRMNDSQGLRENTPAASSSVTSDVNTAPDTVATPTASKPTNKDSKDTCLVGEFDPPLSHIDLATRYGRDPEATRKMLDRWRKRNGDGWHEVDNRRQNEPKYLYRLSAVRTLFEERPSGNVSGNRPAE